MPSLRVLSLSLTVAAALALAWFSSNFFYQHHKVTLENQTVAAARADDAAKAVQGVMALNENVVAGVVAQLSKKRMTATEVNDLLRDTMQRYTHQLRLGVAYQPFALDPTRRLQAPCFTRKGIDISPCRMDDGYDYTAKEYSWYSDALTKGRRWSEARFSESAGVLVADFSMRFTQPGDTSPTGVVVLTLPVSKFESALQAADLGRRGYGFIVSAAGKLIVHPIKDYTRQQISLTKVAASEKSKGLLRLAKVVGLGEDGRINFRSDLTGERSWLNYRHLNNSGWLVCTVTAKGLSAKAFTAEFHGLMKSLLALLVLILAVMLHWLVRSKKNLRARAWFCAGTLSICFLMALGGIWIEALDTPYWDFTNGRPMTSGASVTDFTRQQTIDSINARQTPPQFIPTGIFIQSAEFISPSNVSVTGYIWQRYTKGVNDNLAKGFTLPEAETTEITPIYDWQQGSEHYMGWTFHVTLRQSFDYSNYPFDFQSIWIRMWPKNFDKNVTLVPDISTYTLMDPSAMPGIEEDIVVGGWKPSSSYFEYRFNNYNVNFGLPGYTGQRHFPELYFQFVIQREFMDPFVSHLTPIFLVMLLIFAMLMTISKDVKSRELLGFNAASIIATSAALFFAVLIAHIDIRSRLQTSGIFYLEYFYFITYLVILFVCVNSILFTYEKNMPFIHYEDNLLPKILFWPVVTGLMLGITFWVFY